MADADSPAYLALAAEHVRAERSQALVVHCVPDRVTSISEDRIRGFVSVIAEPKARLDSSREVLVIKPRVQLGVEP